MSSPVTAAAVGATAGPRKRRTWLLLPAVGLAVFLLACSAGWLYARARIDAALGVQTQALSRAGWTARLDGCAWGGFPFRLKLNCTDAALVTPSGWGAEAPGLQAEAVIFDPTHWVYAAPRGLDLHRGAAGVVQVRGRSLSASTAGMGGAVWRVAAVGEGLSLAAAPGARPTAFSRIDRWEAYLRPAADGSGDAEALWRLAGARPTQGGLVWRFSPDAPVEATLTGRFTRLDAFRGSDWSTRVRAWGAAGGAFRLQAAEARGGPTRLRAPGGAVSVGADGRLAGAVPLEIRQAMAGPDAPPAQAAHGATQLVFADGQARLGGLRLGPSPEAAR